MVETAGHKIGAMAETILGNIRLHFEVLFQPQRCNRNFRKGYTDRENATNTHNACRKCGSHNMEICCLSSGGVIQKLHSLTPTWQRACIRCIHFMHAGHCALRRALLRLTGACSAGSSPSSATPRELLFSGIAAEPSAPSAVSSPPSSLAASSRSGSYSDPDS